MGVKMEKYEPLYEKIEEAGFILQFRDYKERGNEPNKGNVDVDLVFEVMRLLIDEPESFNKVLLVSGDGDFKRLVNYLISKGRFKKMLFPNNHPSALFGNLDIKFKVHLDQKEIKERIS